MSRPSGTIDPKDLQGFKYLKKLHALLQPLHEAACQRDHAGNRTLHMDQYVSLLLLGLYSPVCDSLRSLQRASQLPKVQQKLGIPRASLGSLSEAARVFDASLLREIIPALAQQAHALPHSPQLDDLPGVLTAVDGTLLRGLPRTVQALWIDPEHKAFKAHVELEILKGLPVGAQITQANANEKDVLARRLQAGRLYVLDQGYLKYALLQQIMDVGSHFVCRLHDQATWQVLEERLLDDQALAAGVCRDAVVHLGSPQTGGAWRQPVRILQLDQRDYTPKRRRRRREGKGSDTMLLVTDCLDLPADVVALIYARRWDVELFFRFFKHVLGCRHLVSHCQNGVAIQVYVAIIACLLIALYTGLRPTKATAELVYWYLIGLADAADVLAQIRRLKKPC